MSRFTHWASQHGRSNYQSTPSKSKGISRRHILKSGLAFGALAAVGFAPSPARAYITAVLAVANAAVQVAGLFSKGSSALPALVMANHRILRTMQKQMSDLQIELSNIATDINEILNVVKGLSHQTDSEIRQNTLLSVSSTITETRAIIAEIEASFGSRENVDPHLQSLATNYERFRTLRNGLIDIDPADLPQRCLHMSAAMTVELGLIGYFNSFDISRVQSQSTLEFLSRNWLFDLKETTRRYDEYFEKIWNLEGTGEIQIAIEATRNADDNTSKLLAKSDGSDGSVILNQEYCARLARNLPSLGPDGTGQINRGVATLGTIQKSTVKITNEIEPRILAGTPIPTLSISDAVKTDVGNVSFRSSITGYLFEADNPRWSGCAGGGNQPLDQPGGVLDKQRAFFEALKKDRLHELALVHVANTLELASGTLREAKEALK